MPQHAGSSKVQPAVLHLCPALPWTRSQASAASMPCLAPTSTPEHALHAAQPLLPLLPPTCPLASLHYCSTLRTHGMLRGSPMSPSAFDITPTATHLHPGQPSLYQLQLALQ